MIRNKVKFKFCSATQCEGINYLIIDDDILNEIKKDNAKYTAVINMLAFNDAVLKFLNGVTDFRKTMTENLLLSAVEVINNKMYKCRSDVSDHASDFLFIIAVDKDHLPRIQQMSDWKKFARVIFDSNTMIPNPVIEIEFFYGENEFTKRGSVEPLKSLQIYKENYTYPFNENSVRLVEKIPGFVKSIYA